MRGVSLGIAAAVTGLLCVSAAPSEARPQPPASPPVRGGVKVSPKVGRIRKPVFANQLFQDTGVFIDGTGSVDVVYVHGAWQTLPGQDTNADGYGFLAPDGYVLPGQPAGGLIGVVVGDQPGRFYLGLGNWRVPSNLRGELYLIANDDIDQKTGPGFSDNSGSIIVQVFINDR